MDTTENELGGDFDLAFTLSKVGKGGLICCYCSPRNMDSKSSNKIKRWFVKLQITFLLLPGVLHDIENILKSILLHPLLSLPIHQFTH